MSSIYMQFFFNSDSTIKDTYSQQNTDYLRLYHSIFKKTRYILDYVEKFNKDLQICIIYLKSTTDIEDKLRTKPLKYELREKYNPPENKSIISDNIIHTTEGCTEYRDFISVTKMYYKCCVYKCCG